MPDEEALAKTRNSKSLKMKCFLYLASNPENFKLLREYAPSLRWRGTQFIARSRFRCPIWAAASMHSKHRGKLVVTPLPSTCVTTMGSVWAETVMSERNLESRGEEGWKTTIATTEACNSSELITLQGSPRPKAQGASEDEIMQANQGEMDLSMLQRASRAGNQPPIAISSSTALASTRKRAWS